MNNKKINVRKVKNVLLIDTETVMSITDAQPFDIGYIVYNNIEDKVIKQGTCLVRKFVNNKYVMLSSWSANKYKTHYLPLINNKNKNVKVESVNFISNYFKKIIDKYNIKYIVAHNGNFDIKALNRLFKDNNVYNPFEKLDLIDTMELSYLPIIKTKKYKRYCLDNKDIKKKVDKSYESRFITNSGNLRMTAESIYSFITNQPNFEENHTGLEDIKIELEIFKYCKNKKAIFKINTNPNQRKEWLKA